MPAHFVEPWSGRGSPTGLLGHARPEPVLDDKACLACLACVEIPGCRASSWLRFRAGDGRVAGPAERRLEPASAGRHDARVAAHWRVRGEQPILATPWFEVSLADVELPDGQGLEHYVVRLPRTVLTAMLDDQDRILLVWRYRFIPAAWVWELPSGLARPGEDLAAAAAREALAETGWEPADLRPLLQLQALPGLAGAAQHVYWTRRARRRGQPGWETARLDWIPLRDTPALIAAGQISSATTAAAVLHLQATGPAETKDPAEHSGS